MSSPGRLPESDPRAPGPGVLEILQQKDPGHYEKVGTQPTGFGAQTGFFVPALGKLFIATRREQGRKPAEKSSCTRRNRRRRSLDGLHHRSHRIHQERRYLFATSCALPMRTLSSAAFNPCASFARRHCPRKCNEEGARLLVQHVIVQRRHPRCRYLATRA